jgi:hypothetical protein
MARWRRRNQCRICGARWPFVYVSARGLCPDHTQQRMHENTRQLREHRGPYFQRWREAMAASVGGSLLDARSDES